MDQSFQAENKENPKLTRAKTVKAFIDFEKEKMRQIIDLQKSGVQYKEEELMYEMMVVQAKCIDSTQQEHGCEEEDLNDAVIKYNVVYDQEVLREMQKMSQ